MSNRYTTVEDVFIQGKNRLSKTIFECSTSASGIKRTHDCKRPKNKYKIQA